MSKRISNKKGQQRKTPMRSRTRLGWRKAQIQNSVSVVAPQPRPHVDAPRVDQRSRQEQGILATVRNFARRVVGI